MFFYTSSMKRLCLWTVLLATVLTCAAASTKPVEPTECEQEIIAAERTANIHVFERLLANDLVAIGPDGKRHTRTEMLQILKTTPAQQVSASDFLEVPAGRDAVIVNYVVTQPAATGTRRHTATSVWVRRSGQWNMVFHQGTAIPQ